MKPGLGIAIEPMITRPIPSTGEKLPVVGVGTYQTFDVGDNAAAREPHSQGLSLAELHPEPTFALPLLETVQCGNRGMVQLGK